MMAKLILERVEIAQRVAAAYTAAGASAGTLWAEPENVGDRAWAVADRICSRAEEMMEAEAEADRIAKEEYLREQEKEAAQICQRPVAGGFDGPCVKGPHKIQKACENEAGDQW